MIICLYKELWPNAVSATLTGRVRTSSFHVVAHGVNFEHSHTMGNFPFDAKVSGWSRCTPGCADNSFKEHGELCFVVAMPTPTGGSCSVIFLSFFSFFLFCFITLKKYSQSGHMHFKMCIKVMIPLRTSFKREHFIFYKLSDFLCFGSFFFFFFPFLPAGCTIYTAASCLGDVGGRGGRGRGAKQPKWRN